MLAEDGREIIDSPDRPPEGADNPNPETRYDGLTSSTGEPLYWTSISGTDSHKYVTVTDPIEKYGKPNYPPGSDDWDHELTDLHFRENVIQSW